MGLFPIHGFLASEQIPGTALIITDVKPGAALGSFSRRSS